MITNVNFSTMLQPTLANLINKMRICESSPKSDYYNIVVKSFWETFRKANGLLKKTMQSKSEVFHSTLKIISIVLPSKLSQDIGVF